MDRKTYILQRNDKPKPLFVSAEIHHAIKMIAKDMGCSMSEVTYRLIVRGIQWYMERIRHVEGEERYHLWSRDPGKEREQDLRMRRTSPPSRRSPSPPRNTRQRPLPNQPLAKRPSIPAGYVPGNLDDVQTL
jgi:hypothetical protein